MGDGLRPIDMSHDLPQVIDLPGMVFGDSLDGDEHKLFGGTGLGGLNGLAYRMHPALSPVKRVCGRRKATSSATQPS